MTKNLGYMVSDFDGRCTRRPTNERRSWIGGVILLLITGLSLSGCGGGGDATSGSGSIPASSGLEWTQYASGTTDELNSIAYGNGVYVAVGFSGRVLTSTDGRAWTQRNSGTTNWLYGVTYGNGRFIAVGLGGSIMSSIDGNNWTIQNFGTNGFQAVAYGDGKFVVVGYNGVIYTSTDGAAWIIADSHTTEFLFSATYGNGTFVVTGSNGKIITSINGVNWANQISGLSPGTPTVADNNIIGVAYGNGKFCAVSWSWTYRSYVLTSSDGITWSKYDFSPSGADMAAVTYGNGIFIIVDRYIFTSSDGIDWMQRTNSATQTILLHGITYGNGKIVAVGSGILYSEK